jgi:hypothetical protein
MTVTCTHHGKNGRAIQRWTSGDLPAIRRTASRASGRWEGANNRTRERAGLERWSGPLCN